MTDNPDLNLAFDFVQYTNRNIFLTGKAGTGKTTFLHSLKKLSPKRMIVVAPTGVAAINAGGVTIHSFFQLPFHPHVPSLYVYSANTSPVESASFKLSREKVNIIRTLDLLVIDEISMVRADLLDAVDMVLRRFKDRGKPFGGVQLLMIGDIQQLAPVAKDEDREMLEKYYHTTFFFGSHALRSTDYITIELKHIYRQQDAQFIDLLNKVRDNNLDADCLKILNSRYNPDFDAGIKGYITLTTHNAQAQSINDARLQCLVAKEWKFEADIKDDFPEFAYPTPKELILKTGAQVMFVKNDISRDKLFFNGKIGKIEGFEGDRIIVKCPDDFKTISVERAEWQNMKYALNEETKEIEETIIGTFIQYPLKLAWAITIHKSQGLTFDRAIIDARAAFAHGQVYVALSRCRTLEGLVLSTPISPRGIISDDSVTDFIRETERSIPDINQLDESKKAYQRFLIDEMFDFGYFIRGLTYSAKIISEHQESLLDGLPELMQSLMAEVKIELSEVSAKFGNQLNRLFTSDTDAENNEVIQERISKACGYFSEKLSGILEDLNNLPVETDNKTLRKSLTDVLDRIKQESKIKLACLEKAKSGFRIQEYLENRAKGSLDQIAKPKKKSGKKVEVRTDHNLDPVLFNRIRKWRDQKAKETGERHYMILPQKTIATITVFLPQSVEELKLVKGVGKIKAEKYGEEIIELIRKYTSGLENKPSFKQYAPVADIPDKQKKPVRTDTAANSRQMSLELFRSGKSFDQIAKERDMAVSTIEGHISYFIGTGELSISEFLSPEDVVLIAGCFDAGAERKLGPVKAALGDRVSWSEIRFVASYLEYLKKLEAEAKN
jgi:hypothetical protein